MYPNNIRRPGSSRGSILVQLAVTNSQTVFQEEFHSRACLRRVVGRSSANIDGFHLHWTETLDKSLASIELALLVDEPVSKLRGHYWAGFSLLYGVGDVAGARSHASRMLTDAEQLGDNTDFLSKFSCGAGLSQVCFRSDRCTFR